MRQTSIAALACIMVAGGCDGRTAVPAQPAVVSQSLKASVADSKEYSHFAFLFSWRTSVTTIVDLRTNKPVATMSGGYYLAGDRAGDLYAVHNIDDNHQGAIMIYSPRQWQRAERAIFAKTGLYFGAMHVDAHGNLWVVSRSGGNVALKVLEYPRGASKPAKALSTANVTISNLAVDLRENVWAAGQTETGCLIGYWPKGSGNFHPVRISCSYPQGLAFDSAGNMLLEDGGSAKGDVVYVIPPGSTMPSRTIVIEPGYRDDWTGLTLGTAQERFLVQNSNTDTTRIINYASGKTEAYLKYGGGAAAITPASLP